MSSYADFCSTIVTIPQYESTCWFNVILTALLYSQQSRALLLHEMKNGFNKSNKLLMIINKILKSLYVNKDNKASEYFKLMRPEVILSYVKDIEKSSLYQMITKGWICNIFLYKFIENIDRTCIVLDYYNNNLYAGITQSIDIQFDKYVNQYNYKIFETPESIKRKIEKNKNPDYIYVNIWDTFKTSYPFNEILKYYNDNNKKKILALKEYTGFTYSGLDECLKSGEKLTLDKGIRQGLRPFEDEITFNGYIYKLDSCIIKNYNKSSYGHFIAGITCKNHKYVYNGWLKSTNDAAINDDIIESNDPCKLIDYDWDIHRYDDRGTCIDLKNCKLNYLKSQREVKITNLCFSFNLKNKKNLLIYVRTRPINDEKPYDIINKNATFSPSSISSQRSLNSLYEVSSVSSVSPLKSDEKIINDEYDDDDDDYELLKKKDAKYLNKVANRHAEYNIYRGVLPDKEERKKLKRQQIESKKNKKIIDLLI